MRAARRLLVASLLVTAAWPAAVARADEEIYAGPPNQYFTPEVTIDQGEKITFTNFDTVQHDVRSRGLGPDGNPLFASELVSGGGSSPVAGTEYLVSGSYEFFCTLHPQMTGTVAVTTAGTPAQRPGTAPPSAPPPGSPPPASGDKRRPTVGVSVADRRLSSVRRRRAVRLRLSSDEPVSARVTVRYGRRTLGTATVSVSNARTVAVKLSSAGRRALRRARSARLTVSVQATDTAGNAASASTRRTLRR